MSRSSGRGPAGLHAGRLLAQAGLDVQIFEEHAEIGTPTHCTGIVSLEVSEFVKIPDDIILNRLCVARLHGPGGATCEVTWNPTAPDGIVVVDRARFDEHLAEEAVRAGATIHTGAAVLSLTIDQAAARLVLADRVVSARVVILAAGVTYRFHRQLGLPLPPELLHTAQIEVEAAVAPHVELYFGRTIAPEGFVWTVPVVRGTAGRLKIGVLARGPAAMYLRRFLARPDVRAHVGPPSSAPIMRALPLKPLPQSYADRILLVGDAGGFTKPTTGGGIFYSLLTASLAADTLVEAFRAGRFDAAMLAAYGAAQAEMERAAGQAMMLAIVPDDSGNRARYERMHARTFDRALERLLSLHAARRRATARGPELGPGPGHANAGPSSGR